MKRPSFQFYPADHRKDTQLQSCSLAAQGLWVNLMCIMHECQPYGSLSINGQPLQISQIARLVGEIESVLLPLLKELENAGVFSRDTDSTIYSRRMRRDEHIRTVRAEAGKLGGGNPALFKQMVKQMVKQKGKQKPPPSSSFTSSKEILYALELLKSIPGYPFNAETDLQFLQEKEKDFPHVDILSLLKGWKVYLLDKPLKKKLNPRSQLHRQFEFAMKYMKHQSDIISIKDVAKNVLKFVEDRAENRNSLSGISSGFSNIDKLTDGWQRGDLIIPASRPSIGKTAFALTLAENAGVSVGVISLEMGSSQLGIRTLSSLSGVELWRLRKGIIQSETWGDIHSAIARMAEKDIFFSFTARNVSEIERVIFQMVELHGIQLLILDYLQLVLGTDRKRSREQEVAEISRMLKNAAQVYNIPVIALAQLNREVEKRENKRPLLSDLRDSGQIEQDADVIIFLYDDEDDPEILNLNFAKGRNIGLGTVQLHFNKDLMTFKERI